MWQSSIKVEIIKSSSFFFLKAMPYCILNPQFSWYYCCLPKISCMDTLCTFGLPSLCCYLSAWFLYLHLLLSFSAHHWISQLIHLPISQNLACLDTGNLLEELRLSGENKFPYSVLLNIMELAPSYTSQAQVSPIAPVLFSLSLSTKYSRSEQGMLRQSVVSMFVFCLW